MTVYPNTSTRVEDAAGIRGTDVDDEIKVERYKDPRLHERNVLAQSPYPWCVHCTAGRGVGQRNSAVEEQIGLLCLRSCQTT